MLTTRTMHLSKIVAAVAGAFLVWGLVLAYASSPAHAATTYTVDRIDDPALSTTPAAGACTAAANDCSLRGAITAANANAGDDTIDIGLTGTVNLTGELPDLSSNIKIEGPGAGRFTVRRDSGGDYRIFTITRDTTTGDTTNVTISGITISNGDTPDDGGGILYGGGGILTVNNSTISGNSARFDGGGIVNDAASTTITNSTISGNSARFDGGGIYNDGDGPLTVTDSTIGGNTASSGGGIYNGDDGPLTVSGTTISGNTAAGGTFRGGEGGGIYSDTEFPDDDPDNDPDTSTTITDSTISGNSAEGEVAIGGGVFNQDGLTVIEFSTITNNAAPNGQGSGVASSGDHFTPTEVLSSIISANQGTDVDFVIFDNTNSFVSKGYNLIGDDGNDGNATGAFNNTGDQVGTDANPINPLLGPLADNGGPTMTHALLTDSPAIDAGPPTDGDPACPPPTTDQRGVTRPQDGNADSTPRCDVGSFELTGTNTAPQATDDAYSTDEDTTLTVATSAGVLDNDEDVDNAKADLKAVLVSGPSHGQLTLNNDGSFTYTPNANYNGPDSFTYKSKDGDGGEDTATVSITVNSVNDAPVAKDDSATTDEDTPTTIAVLSKDADADGDALSVSDFDATSTEGGTLTLNADGTLTYTPAADYNGPDSFTYTVSDGKGGTDTASVNLTVSPVNDAPTCEELTLQTKEDTEGSAAPKCSDVDADSLSYSIASQPNHGRASVEDGLLLYNPDPDYDGPDSFAYRASDGRKSSNLATVRVDLTPVNDRPTVEVAQGGSCGTDQRSGTILLSISDVDDPNSSLSLAASSSKRTLVPRSNISFSGSGQMRTMHLRAAEGNSGTAKIEITLSDGTLKSTEIVGVEVDNNGSNSMEGTKDTDMLFGLGGADVVGGAGASDLLCSGDGVDIVEGANGQDALFGGAGRDIIRAGKGDDRLSGGGEDDRLFGEAGSDTMSGGTGADLFSGGSGQDEASDFSPSQGDTKDTTLETF